MCGAAKNDGPGHHSIIDNLSRCSLPNQIQPPHGHDEHIVRESSDPQPGSSLWINIHGSVVHLLGEGRALAPAAFHMIFADFERGNCYV